MKKKMHKSQLMTSLRAVALGCAVLLAPLSTWAQNSVQAIHSSQQLGADVVRIELAEPLAVVPAGFTIQAPPRIAIDLPGVANGLGRPNIELNQGNLRSASIAQSGERTRLVLNLKQAANYRAQLQGKVLLLVLDKNAATAATKNEPLHFAESLNRDTVALRDIDFRRGQENSGRVVVDLANNQVGVDIRQQGQSLVVEFLRSSLPEQLRRSLDVSDFGTPVQKVTMSQAGDRVRMVVEPRGNWEHSAYQSDNQFVLEVRAQKDDPNKLVQGAGYQGEKLSLNFQNIEVRSLLQVIADFTNFNVVTSDSVTGNVTLRLKDVPWDQALDIILQAKSLGVRKSGNVLWIAPKDEIAAKEKLELESQAQISALEPVRTQSFQLNYSKAEAIAKGLAGEGSAAGGEGAASSRILTNRGSVIAETRTNQLFVTDIPAKLEEIQRLITKIDVPVRQVLIEARIVEANDSFGRSLGVKLGATDLKQANTGTLTGYAVGGSNRVAMGTSYGAIGTATGQGGESTSTTDSQFFSLPANGMGYGSPATFALSLFNASAQRFLNLELSALEADGKGKIVSSPRVITADQVKALIEQGTELPYQAATSSGATQVQFKKANLKLEVVPQITPEGNVILDVDVNKDSVGQQTSAGFAIDTKHVKTQVLVENGGTVVIGGIFTMDERTVETKVPLLGDLPALGHLFKSRTRTAEKKELLIFITPKLVSDKTAAR